MTATVICINTKIPGRVHYMVRLIALEKRFVLHANITLRRHGYALPPPKLLMCVLIFIYPKTTVTTAKCRIRRVRADMVRAGVCVCANRVLHYTG